ncbi:VanZ family protein [Nocardia sp. NPDC003482]
MDHYAALPAPPSRLRRAVLVGLALLGAATALYIVRRPLLMPLRPRRGGVADWHVWLCTGNGVALLTIAAAPLAGLAVWVLARRRTWRIALAEVGMVYGTVPWVWLIMQPGEHPGTGPGRVSLVPLRDLAAILGSGEVTATIQIVGNLLVFAALGFFAPVRFPALASVPRILALAAGCSVLVETAQYVLQLDRVSSVDDVLLNTAGAGFAALASRGWWAPIRRAA